MLNRLRRFLIGAPQPRFVPPVYMGDNTVLLRTAHVVGRSYKLYVDTRDISLAPHIIMEGIWEPGVSRLLEAQIKPGMRVVEVGSNIGYHTLQIADLIGPNGRMKCFEANSRLAQLLAMNVEVNGLRERAEIYYKAAADREGEAEFKVFARHLGASSFFVSDGTAEDFHDSISVVTVPLTTLDVTCADWSSIDFLKIDAEGAEPMILAGAKSLLTRSPNVKMLLEFGPGAFFSTRETAGAFLDGFTAEGFVVSRVTPEGEIAHATREELLSSNQMEELFVSRGG